LRPGSRAWQVEKQDEQPGNQVDVPPTKEQPNTTGQLVVTMI
jgi:hypothetical protein